MKTVDAKEIENFEKVADEWWDESGPFKPLHKLNPTRIQYLRQQIENHFGIKANQPKPFQKLNILDIGCGGGLVCEPMTRLGAKMTGVDASEKNINIAITHATSAGLDIEYLPTTAEAHLASLSSRAKSRDLDTKKQISPRASLGRDDAFQGYDVVLALEIIEHVTDPAFFIETCTKLIKKDGLIIFSTLNRTPKSFALGIVAAEYILRWLPKGTHNWKKFLKPHEIAKHLREQNFESIDITGLIYNPLSDEFSLSTTDIKVNYFLAAKHNSK